VTYDSVDFGVASLAKGILVSHSKGDHGGTIEIRLGDQTGSVVAEFTPAMVGNWDQYQTAYIGVSDVEGVHDVTFVAKEGDTILNIAWFEVSDFPKRSKIHARIAATEYSDQRGTSFHGPNTSVGWFDNTDYMTYSSVNFGDRGTTFSLNFNYAKASHGGRIDIRLGGPDGKLIGEYKPANTKNNWHAYETVNVGIDGVEGIHDLTFVGRDVSGVWNLLWFELSEKGETKSNAPSPEPSTYGPSTLEPTSEDSSSVPSLLPSVSPTAPTTDEACDNLEKKECPNTCSYGKKKKVKTCVTREKYNCASHSSETACDSTAEGFCEWKDGTCSHKCLSLSLSTKACKKMKTGISNEKMCKLKKVSNPCFGCHPKRIC